MAVQGGGSREGITLLLEPFLHELIKLQRAVMGAGAGKLSVGWRMLSVSIQEWLPHPNKPYTEFPKSGKSCSGCHRSTHPDGEEDAVQAQAEREGSASQQRDGETSWC